ncbi:MAG: hypothetical protein D6689_15045 [Deltaproteobacteria bacterium]|nr:MAG: hypothetical protein D6689_15045 [Deltaproteobacteria bacterium]
MPGKWKALAEAAPPAGDRAGAELLLEGWRDLANAWLLADMAIVLTLAIALAAAIAYHPATRRRMSTLDHFEQPKTILLYAVIGAVVALIVEVQPAMAFVIFGIGGLMRFRTLVGEAKDTGRVILVTVVGLCCGLKIYVVAIPATAVGWLLIYLLERQTAGIIRVSGVGEDAIHEATRAYRTALEAAGLRIIGEQTKFLKREFAFVVQAPPGFDRSRVEADLDALPAAVRGVVDFERL